MADFEVEMREWTARLCAHAGDLCDRAREVSRACDTTAHQRTLAFIVPKREPAPELADVVSALIERSHAAIARSKALIATMQ